MVILQSGINTISNMDFKKSAGNWEGLAKADPLWSICTDPSKKGNKWEPDEFFSTGYDEMEVLFDYLFLKQFLPFDRDKALDFGCGAGRLSRALTNYFSDVVGVDVSESMIKKASELNIGISDKLSFIHNPSPDLKLFKSEQFSFIFSSIVLQHIPPANSEIYISEFLRLLKPGGILIFQIPVSKTISPSLIQKIKTFIRFRERLAHLGIGKGYAMDMHCLDEEKIKNLVSSPKIQLLDIVESNHCVPDFNGKLVLGQNASQNSSYLSKVFIINKKF